MLSADGSVGSPHVRVGHRQALKHKPPFLRNVGFFVLDGAPPTYLIQSLKVVVHLAICASVGHGCAPDFIFKGIDPVDQGLFHLE